MYRHNKNDPLLQNSCGTVMKQGLSNKKDHNLHTHSNRFKDLIDNFERMDRAISWCIYICFLTFSFVAVITATRFFIMDSTDDLCLQF
jgi:hypothetical protein